jgi:hypothetical protein
MWDDLTLTRLREIARHYNKTVKIAGISKMKKDEVISELKKHLDLASDNKSVKHKTNKSDIMLFEKGEPNVVGEYKATGEEGGAKYAKVQSKKKVDKAKLEKELADLERKSAMKKRIKKQGEGAVADAKAIKAPTVAEATDMTIKKKKQATIKKRTEKSMTEAEAKAELERLQKEAKAKKDQEKAKNNPPPPPKKVEDKSYTKGVVAKKVVQARGASADAKAIKPPEMEVEKDTKSELVISMTEKIPYEMNELIKEYIPPKMLEAHTPNLARALIEGARAEKAQATFNTIEYILLHIKDTGIFGVKREHTAKYLPVNGMGESLLKKTNDGVEMLGKLFTTPIDIDISSVSAGMGNKAGTRYSLSLNNPTKDDYKKRIETLKSEASALLKKLWDLKERGIMKDLLARSNLESAKKREATAKVVASTASTQIPVGKKNAILVPLREIKPYLVNSGRNEKAIEEFMRTIDVWLHKKHNIAFGGNYLKESHPQLWNNTVISVFKGKTGNLTYEVKEL